MYLKIYCEKMIHINVFVAANGIYTSKDFEWGRKKQSGGM